MTEQTDTVVIQHLRELRALREDVAALREKLRGLETKVDGLAAIMAAVAGKAAQGGGS